MGERPHTGERPAGLARWWIYQRERFPLLGHGPLILAFSSGAVCFSALLRHDQPQPRSLLVAFVSSLLFFFQLRVDDEHKDLADDTQWRPYRPVPRGLVTLRELSAIGWGSRVVQLGLAYWLDASLPLLLLLTWGYMALMRHEFWMHDYLKRHPAHTLWTHMLVMPFIDLYATACDWLPNGGVPPSGSGLFWFLVASFTNGMVVEVGRKLRATADEETGVDTYTRVWGRHRSVAVWFTMLGLTFVSALLAARQAQAVVPVAISLGALLVLCIASGRALIRHNRQGSGKRLELLAGLWTIALYVSLGVVPAIMRWLA